MSARKKCVFLDWQSSVGALAVIGATLSLLRSPSMSRARPASKKAASVRARRSLSTP